MKKRFLFVLCLCFLLATDISGWWSESKGIFQDEFVENPVNNQVPGQIIYEIMFHRIYNFDKKAKELELQGKNSLAKALRTHFQRKGQLNEEQAEILRQVAQEFFNEVALFDKRAERLIKEISDAGKFTDEEIMLRDNLNALQESRNLLSLNYLNLLRERLGLIKFESFVDFVRQDIALKIRRLSNLGKFGGNGYGISSVDYDSGSQQIYGDSETYFLGFADNLADADYIGRLGGGCPNPCTAVEVDASLTNQTTGEILDSGVEYACGSGHISIFLGSDAYAPESNFCVTGNHYGGYAWLPLRFSQIGQCQAKNPPLGNSEGCVTTPELTLENIEFELISTDSPALDENPNIGGGQRIFPDDNTPGDTANRQQIRVTARVSNNIPNVRVYFGNFDVDDPTTDPIIDTNGNQGGDNNGNVGGNSAGQLNLPSAVTNNSGVATVNFTVTRQPGDNFVIAAALEDEIGNITVNGTDLMNGNVALGDCDGTETICRSEMLTVWRRLHIEVDSMGNVSGNLVSGAVPNEVRVRRNETAIVALNNTLEVNRFENGRFVLGGPSLEVLSNTANTITVRNNNQPTVYAPANSQFQLYDDDDFNDNNGTNLDGDIGEDVTEPSRNLLTQGSDDLNTNVLAPIYIRPVYDVVDNTDNSYFLANAIGDLPSDTQQLFIDRDLTTTNIDVEFWTVYVLGSYQHTTIEDNDPATEAQTFGIADGIPHFVGDGSGVLIHLEAHNSTEILDYPASASLRNTSTTVAHEIGHLLSGRHGDGGIMTNGFGQITSAQFSPTTVRRIRALLTHP
jgi:hypothetical protein